MDFVAKNNKSYKYSAEMDVRKANWKKAKWDISAMNNNKSSAVFAINFTADLNDEEYKQILGISMDAATQKKVKAEL